MCRCARARRQHVQEVEDEGISGADGWKATESFWPYDSGSPEHGVYNVRAGASDRGMYASIDSAVTII